MPFDTSGDTGEHAGGKRRVGAAVAIALRLALAAATACAGLAGCATPSRLPAAPAGLESQAVPEISDIRYLTARDPSGFAEAARAAFRREVAWRAAHGETGPLPPAELLAISGGGDDGAFTAGLLNGWTAHGDRPEFKGVTGVSTGALIAPFAFLGSRYDGVLTKVYTQVSQRDIFLRRRLLRAALFGDALSDTTPLYKLISRYVDRNLLDAIAAEYAKGRLLLVGTTNLDTLEPVIWNLTAIASSKDPGALELFRKVMVASASIPGAFPPVMIDVTVNGVHYQEMHVDGGATTQVFAYPPSLQVAQEAAALGADRRRDLYVIRNARLDPEWASVRRRTLPIAGRAITSLMQTQGIGDLYRIYVAAKRDGIDFNLAYIPASFNTPHTKQFDTTYMRSLYQLGYQLGAAGYDWRKVPPGFNAPLLKAAR